MPSFDNFPYTNFHELNLDYFIQKFKEIFDEWDELYTTMTSWKDATDADLAAWKTDTLADMDVWETALLASLDAWKTETGADITAWEAGVLSDLADWKDTFTAYVASITADAEAARDAAAGSATAAAGSATAAAGSATAAAASASEAAASAASIAAEAAQIAENTTDISDLIANFDSAILADGTVNIKNNSENYTYGAIDASTGADSGTNPSRIRSTNYINSYNRKIIFTITSANYSGFIYKYENSDGTGYIGRNSISYGTPYEDSGGFYRCQLAKTDGTSFYDSDKTNAANNFIITNYAIYTDSFTTNRFSLTYKNINDFINSADYDNTDYSYTQVTEHLNSTNAENDKCIPVVIELPNRANAIKKSVIISTVNSYSPHSAAPRNIYDFNANERYAVIKNLIPGKTYYFWIYYTYADGSFSSETSGTFRTTGGTHVRFISAENIQNVRDIGGWIGANGNSVKYGNIIRGSSLDEDNAKNLKIFDSGIDTLTRYLNIGTDIDLRSDHTASPLGNDITYVSAPIQNYTNLISNSANVKNIIEAMNTAFADGKTVYIHCQGGCDRTGSIITIILGLLGVSESNLSKEYELSCFSKIGGGRYRNSDSYNYKGMIEAIKNLPGNTLPEKINDWLIDAGLTQDEIDTFINYMI